MVIITCASTLACSVALPSGYDRDTSPVWHLDLRIPDFLRRAEAGVRAQQQREHVSRGDRMGKEVWLWLALSDWCFAVESVATGVNV